MKKVLSIVLLITLILTAMTYPVAAEVDATTSATATAPATTTPAPAPTPAAPVPAPVSTTVATPSKTPGEVYTVVSGDAFWKIAQKFNLTIDQLAKLNPQIKNISLIHVGDKIFVTAETTALATPAVAAKKLYHGFGEAANYRIKASGDSLNIATASVIFDENDKIVDLTWDVMEISKKLFPGWLDATQEQAAIDTFVDSIGTWETKRERGFDYDMTHLKSKGAADNLSQKEWFVQLDYYEEMFKGMTVAEVSAWMEKYTDVNGRPYKMAYPDKLTEEDKAATAALTADEIAMLVDVTTSATMAIEDVHSHLYSALLEAFEAREEIK